MPWSSSEGLLLKKTAKTAQGEAMQFANTNNSFTLPEEMANKGKRPNVLKSAQQQCDKEHGVDEKPLTRKVGSGAVNSHQSKRVRTNPATRNCLNDPKVRFEVVPKDYKQYLADDADEGAAEIEYSNNDPFLERMMDYERRNHAAVAKLNSWGFNGDALKGHLPRAKPKKIATTGAVEGDDTVKVLSVDLHSHSDRFITVGSEPLNSDDYARSLAYIEAKEQHTKDKAANEELKAIYEYQLKAAKILAKNKPLERMTKDELEPVIQFGLKLRDPKAPIPKDITKKNLFELREFYAAELQNLVQDKSAWLDKPPDSIPEPSIPSLEDIILEQRENIQKATFMSMIRSATSEDIPWLKALARICDDKLSDFDRDADDTNESNA